jgi:uncharacterized protein (DUF885 family)
MPKRPRAVSLMWLALLNLGFFAVSEAAVTAQDKAEVSAPGDMRVWIEQAKADEESLRFRYRVPLSDQRGKKLADFYQDRLTELAALDFPGLSYDDQIDFLLIKNYLQHEQRLLAQNKKRDDAAAHYLPYAESIVRLSIGRENAEPISGRAAAEALHELTRSVQTAIDQLSASQSSADDQLSQAKKMIALRAAENIGSLRRALAKWHAFYDGYAPEFSWWTKEPYKVAAEILTQHERDIRNRIVGVPMDDNVTIIGEPIGESALLEELAFEMIPYTPSELVDIANEQFALCDAEMEKAAKGLGFKEWREAQEHVKTLHVEPGDQPEMIRTLAYEAIAFLETRDLVTIPPLAKDGWRMEMMTPDQQRVNPFFLGGDTIIVSYPTDTMTHDEKLMSMRGNNEHFSRATVQHELIPGHHLQQFMNSRYRPYRQMFSTPFWIEGWALYWEMLLWDLEFPRNDLDRIGMLFWRKHRCARIIFSLNYQQGKWTPQECIDFLIERVGHEPNNAQAEVRRSVMAGYGPLYQAGYMLGGLQIRALHKELVQSGKMSNRDFHDAILKENMMPIEILRTKLTRQKLTSDFKTTWRFNEK